MFAIAIFARARRLSLSDSLSVSVCVCMSACGPPRAFEVITITAPLPSSDTAAAPGEGAAGGRDAISPHQSGGLSQLSGRFLPRSVPTSRSTHAA